MYKDAHQSITYNNLKNENLHKGNTSDLQNGILYNY